MKKLLVWAELTLKRVLQKKGFLLLIIALPLLGWFLSFWGSHQTSGVEVGLVTSHDPVAKETIEELLSNEGLFQFVRYDSEEDLVNAVVTRQLEAGFVFDPELSMKIGQQDHRNLIRLVRSPSTVTHGMAGEVVFSEMLRAASPVIIADMVESGGLFPGREEVIVGKIVNRFEEYDQQGGTFHFSYEFLDGKPVANAGIPLFPLKGLLAIFIMLTAWINVLSWYKDHSDGVYDAFPTNLRQAASLISIILPVLIIILAGFLLLLVYYPLDQALKELVYLLLYGLAVSLFLFGAKIFFPSPIAYGTLLPVALLGSLVASPVFLDMSGYIEHLEILEKLFLPSYYLGMSSGFKSWAVAGTLALALAGIILITLESYGNRRFGKG